MLVEKACCYLYVWTYAVGLVSRALALNKLDISSNEIYAY